MGLTDDRVSCPRRGLPRDLETVFAAFHLRYARYFDPWDGTLCSFEQAAQSLAFLRDHQLAHGGPLICLGMSRWKQKTMADFLRGAGGEPKFRRSSRRAVKEAAATGGKIVVWASRERPELAALCEKAKVPLQRCEDGFLRSVGLVAALAPASSVVVDASGIYYDGSRPCDLERLIEYGPYTEELLLRARRLREQIVTLGLSKYNLPGLCSQLPDLPEDRKIVLVPGQVEDDASIRLGSPTVCKNLDLLAAARARRPNDFIIFKPHPDVTSGYRKGAIPDRETMRYADLVLSDAPISAVLKRCHAVETMTSLVGFEALIRGLEVAAHGMPFYAGWGLTEDILPIPRRRRRATLDELTAAALILYPLYLDPVSRQPCPPDVIVRRLSSGVMAKEVQRSSVRAVLWHLKAFFRRRSSAIGEARRRLGQQDMR